MKDIIKRSKSISTLVETSSGDVFKMSAFEYSRWLALIDAISVIEQGATKLKVDLDNDPIDWVQPIAIEKYIREKYADILNDLMHNEEFLSLCTTSSDSPSVSLEQQVAEPAQESFQQQNSP